MENKKSAAVYCRLAQATQMDDGAMDLQKQQVLQYAAELGYINPIVYTDNGASGLTYDRPAFSAMNDDIAAGKIDAVIVQSISRIGRSLIETQSWIDRTKRKGITLKALDGSLDCQHSRCYEDCYLNLGKKITT